MTTRTYSHYRWWKKIIFYIGLLGGILNWVFWIVLWIYRIKYRKLSKKERKEKYIDLCYIWGFLLLASLTIVLTTLWIYSVYDDLEEDYQKTELEKINLYYAQLGNTSHHLSLTNTYLDMEDEIKAAAELVLATNYLFQAEDTYLQLNTDYIEENEIKKYREILDFYYKWARLLSLHIGLEKILQQSEETFNRIDFDDQYSLRKEGTKFAVILEEEINKIKEIIEGYTDMTKSAEKIINEYPDLATHWQMEKEKKEYEEAKDKWVALKIREEKIERDLEKILNEA